ncbi:MAG: biotin--[acetyl-CoA-carboxylase] ligase [candidate division WOR-3 bacterium]
MEPFASLSGEILSRLARFGRVCVLDTVNSTNDYAFSLVDRKEPVVVVARRQTKGRGRFRRRWFSDHDSLVFSVLLFPKIGALVVGGLTQIVGLALCRAIEIETGLKPVLRWPNDVLHGEKKLAGILCEARRGAVVVGVGINLNQSEFPTNLPSPGSLYQALGRRADGLALLETFLEQLYELVSRVEKSGAGSLLPEVKDRSAVLNKRVEVRTMFKRQVGTVIDLDADGRIVLRIDSGRLVVLSAGQVRQLR